MYRHVQLISGLCNEIQQKMLLAPLIVIVILINSFSLAILAHVSIVSENLILACFLVAVFVDSVLIILFCLGEMVAVNRRSKAFIQNLKFYNPSTLGESDRLWTRKFAQACQPIKIKFGANNFIEKLTPLKCLSCAARLTIQILLSERRYGG